jgi:membrane protein
MQKKVLSMYTNGREFISIINRHNIFSFSASLSYYAALALAPFLLILLKVGSLIGQDAQDDLIFQAEFILGEDAGRIVSIVFDNINQGISFASFSGIIGVVILLFTISVLLLQLRLSMDVIKGDYDPNKNKDVWDIVKERLFIMLLVIGLSVLFFLSLFFSNIVKYFAGDQMANHWWGQMVLIGSNFLINLAFFTALYYFIPSNRQPLNHAYKMGLLTSVCFLLGKIFIGLYLERIAGNSVYGAAGSLLVFLVWAYYSSFIMFFSMELFLFFHDKKIGLKN